MTKVIPIDIYDTDILVVIGTIDEAKRELADYGVNPMPIVEKITTQTKGLTYLLDMGQLFLWLPSKPYMSNQRGTMAHEIYHAANIIMQKVGINLSVDSEEAYAYLIGLITSKIEDMITLSSDDAQ